jgi:bacterial/archaeal transporter family-2 protein
MIGYLLLAFVAGGMVAFQAGVNAQLGHWVESPVRAAFVSFLVGTIALAIVATMVVRKSFPSLSRLGDAPWWVWIGGLLGAFYVGVAIITAPKLGAATLIAAVIAGQTVTSVVIDQYGWVGFKEHHLSPGRIAGVVLVAGGVALVRFF